MSQKLSKSPSRQTDISKTVRLNIDHFPTSNELIKLFKKASNQIKVTNKTDQDNTLDVIIARKAMEI